MPLNLATTKKVRSIRCLMILALSVAGLGGTVAVAADDISAGPLRYEVIASAPRLNRSVTGPVTAWVHGVPAEPVDSFVYDGEGSVEVEGHLYLIVDPIAETGLVEASWSDENGEWSYRQTVFIHPEHLSGVRIGSSVSTVDFIINEGIAETVHLHGDTSAGMPVLPTLFVFLAAWGPADVERNGQPFPNPFELPAPQWLGHLMVSEGVRQPDGSVRTLSGGIYDPSHAAEGAVERGDLEAHLVFHDERFPTSTSFPPLFSFFYHLVFEDVSIQLIQADEAIPLDPDDPGAGLAVVGDGPPESVRGLRRR